MTCTTRALGLCGDRSKFTSTSYFVGPATLSLSCSHVSVCLCVCVCVCVCVMLGEERNGENMIVTNNVW